MRSFVARRGDWLALPLGALLAAAFAPTGIMALAFLCPAGLFVLWQGAGPRQAAWRGFLFTFGTFLAGTYWINHSVHLIGGAPLWLALLLMLGLCVIMAAYTAAAGYIAARWLPRSGALRWIGALPALWVLAEWLRGWVLSGFPWLSLGYSQLQSPLAGYAPVSGVYGTGFVTAALGGAIVALAIGRPSARIAAALTLMVAVGVGAALQRVVWTSPVGPTLEVALVQGAVPQVMKWDAAQRQHTLDLYANLTASLWGRPLIVWPEAALPALANDLQDYLAPLRSRAAASGSALIIGLLRRDPASGDYHNGLVAYAPQAEDDDEPDEQPDEQPDGQPDGQWYYKRRLVPFGEFFPVPDAVREWMRLMKLPYSDFVPGSNRQPPLVAAGVRLAPTICYEDAYGAEQIGLVRDATVLVNVSNDAWFGDSTAPHQHLDVSRMRSLESGRPTLRATNDGITALIDADGSVLARLAQFRPGVLSGSVQPREGLTPYLRFGNAPVIALALSVLAAAALLRRRHEAGIAQVAS